VTAPACATYEQVMRYVFAGFVTLAFAALIAGALAARPGGSARPRASSPPPRRPDDTKPRAPSFLVELAARTATNNCDAHPTGASYARTMRRAAEAMAGDGVDSDPPVYLVLLRGRFVDYGARGI